MIFSIEDGREHFYQWDSNRKLIIHDEDITEVHFCNKTDDCSLVTEVYSENGTRYANVPNVLLTTDWSIKVYAFDKYYTKHCETYKVIPRTKPADYAYEETEVMNWHTLEDKLDKLIYDVGQAEVSRMSNEEYRELGEFERREAEYFRQDNETAREEAETARREVFDNLTADVIYLNNQATNTLDAANEALANSEGLLEDAKLATDNANEAADIADKATSAATNAATEARAATKRALEATNSVMSATIKVDMATDRANIAATGAETATINANNAATGANEAADRANEAAEGINNKFANALKGEASGAIVSMKDVSPVEHTVGVKATSKNLFYINGTRKGEDNGLSYDLIQGQSSFIINGSSTKSSNFKLSEIPLKAGTYTIAIYGSNVITESMDRIFLRYTNTSGGYVYVNNIINNKPKSFTLPYDVTARIEFIFAENSTYENKEICIQIEEGAVATAYTPYIDVTQAKLLKQGKNLLDISSVSRLTNGTYSVENGVGEIVQTGSRAPNIFLRVGKAINFVGKTLTLSFTLAESTGTGTNSIDYYISKWIPDDSTTHKAIVAKSAKFVGNHYSISGVVPESSEEEELIVRFYCGILANVGEFIKIKDVQVEIGATITEYEPYIEPTEYPISADGTVEGVNSLYPTTTLVSDTIGVRIDAEYNRDINKAFAELQQAIISLGGNV